MPSTETYHAVLRDLPAADWEPYLLSHSNLPGPRVDLELAQAVAHLGTEAPFRQWASLGPDVRAGEYAGVLPGVLRGGGVGSDHGACRGGFSTP